MNTPLISAAELAALLGAKVLVVDCRFSLANTQAGEAAWQAGHIPGAVYAHLDRDLSGPKTGGNGRHPLPDQDAFIATLHRWGWQAGMPVVAYDDAGGMFAARLWWMLTQWLGHAPCAVLDGGWAAWQGQGGAIDTASPGPVAHAHDAPTLAPQHPAPAGPAAVVRVQDVLASLNAPAHTPGKLLLIDARAPDRFAGQNETLDPVGGHIPGALNRFFQHNLQPDGRFKPAAILREEFTQLLGDTAPSSVAHQCGSGVTACHNLLAMQVAGLPGSRLYAGSWSEWCADPARPVARSS